MKVIMFECTEEELKANRGIMNAVVDAMRDFTNRFWGTIEPVPLLDPEEEDEEDKEQA